ncbi:hypothetical protein FRB97_005885 [Tulasnella sp. 331]|nr:hypothetical protein FRB97_005885 [Tulasnella sp. 331]
MLGSCCSEMDIWKANKMFSAYTPYPCTSDGLLGSPGSTCVPICDQAGCDFNSPVGETFHSTVLAQGSPSTPPRSSQSLPSSSPPPEPPRVPSARSVASTSKTADAFCKAQKTSTGDPDSFKNLGGLTEMRQAMSRVMVLVLSIWDDYEVDMLWLGSDYPTTTSPSAPGVARGSSAISSSVPTQVEVVGGSIQEIYSNINLGDSGSTNAGSPYVAPGGTAPPHPPRAPSLRLPPQPRSSLLPLDPPSLISDHAASKAERE